jgi:hypothetical protein
MRSTVAGFTAAGVLLLAISAAPQSRAGAPVTRSVYVTIHDEGGAGVSDLTPADFILKEGGQEREVLKIERASAKIRLSIAVEETLMGDMQVRIGLFELMKRMIGDAEIRLLTSGVLTTTVVDYTSSLDVLVAGINKLSRNPSRQTEVLEGIEQMSREFSKEKAQRPVIVLVTRPWAIYGGGDLKDILAKLRDSRAMLYVAAWLGGAPKEVESFTDQVSQNPVLGDGPIQSGGLRLDVAGTNAIPRTLLQIADDLHSQYLITYELPPGVKPHERFQLTVKRQGLTLRAPTTIAYR